MNKNRIILYSTVISCCFFIQFLFISGFQDIAALEKHEYIKKKISNAVSLSSGKPAEFSGIIENENSLILELPSTSEKYAVMPGYNDHTAFIFKSNVLVMSLYPSEMSARKNKSVYVKNIESFEFEHTSELIFFSDTINGTQFASYIYIDRDFHLLPQNTEVF